MTRQAREAISLAFATALGEAVLQGLMITDWSNAGAHALLFAFLVGPPLFLALLAWRRRDHAARSRVLFGVAALIAVGGLGALAVTYWRLNENPQFRKEPNMVGLVVPLAQWAVVMGVWLWLAVAEARDNRLAAQAGQPGQVAGGTFPPKPPQSA